MGMKGVGGWAIEGLHGGISFTETPTARNSKKEPR